MIGVDLKGMKHVLGIWIGEAESAKFWITHAQRGYPVLSKIKSQGTHDILLCCVDNLSGFSEAIAAAYPATRIQKCLVHQVRNSLRFVSYKDAKQVASALRAIYTVPSESAALAALDRFEAKWGQRYPLVVASWKTNWSELVTFFGFPPELRRLMYTTNVIESFNRQLRKLTKGKGLFPPMSRS